MNPSGFSTSGSPSSPKPPPAPAFQCITCDGKDQFMDVIEGLVRRGIGFKANFDAMSITLTGGH